MHHQSGGGRERAPLPYKEGKRWDFSELENKLIDFVSGAWEQKPLVDSQESEDKDEMLRRAIAMSLEVQMKSVVEKEEDEESECWRKCNIL